MIERTRGDENEQVEEHNLHTLAREVLHRHNMSSLFSYRYAFILGYEEAQKLFESEESNSATRSGIRAILNKHLGFAEATEELFNLFTKGEPKSRQLGVAGISLKVYSGWCPKCQELTSQETTVDPVLKIARVVCTKCNSSLAERKLPTEGKNRRPL